MKTLHLFFYEWKHFSRSPFKIIALLLFIIAGIYGLHNGAKLYRKQSAEIEKIEQKVSENRKKIVEEYYRKGKSGPEDRPWIDYSTPFWSVWYSSVYQFKKPAAAMVYSIGQGEQYGFYKQVTYWSSPYDADLAEEIANPERLQSGMLDFSFVLLFLLPLVLLVLLYNLKTTEIEQGFMPLVEVQHPSKTTWLLTRVVFYAVVVLLVVVGLLIYGATLTSVFEKEGAAFGQMLVYSVLYLLFWIALYFLVLLYSRSLLGSTLKMTAVYLLLTFVVPAAVHQTISVKKPANLMTDMISVRDQLEDLFGQPDSVIQVKLNVLFPEILNSPVFNDTAKMKAKMAMNYSASSLANDLNKRAIQPIEQESRLKNEWVEATYWFNPLSFFQNKFNSIAQTHFNDYQDYRNSIQNAIDLQIKVMVTDTWNGVKDDEKKYKEYLSVFQ